MAGNIPTPRSYQSILGDMVDTLLSRYGLRGLKVGGPLLTLLEAAAQSDVRSSQDVFNLLDADSLDRTTGIALDRNAAKEEVFRQPAIPSSGKIDFSDSSFTKISTKIYPGATSVNAGSTVIKLSDASGFPTTGRVYIGRGTVNYEGPLNYTSIVKVGSYWQMTLATPTVRFHDINESVILAQGGLRTILAGQKVRTAQGNAARAVSFTTLYSAAIEDGETIVKDVEVVCDEPGIIGNVPRNAITEVVGSPFGGATVTNPVSFDNGLPADDDVRLRERIRAARRTRSKGTDLALITAARGVTAKDENKTVLSASIVSPKGEPTTLYIDDGTGYEERTSGVGLEVLTDQALGGEQYFQLTSARPVTKAFVTTSLTAPFTLKAASKLAIEVAGVLYEHSFDAAGFRSIGNATAYEVVASINSNPNIGFSARTVDGGTRVVIFSRTETNEEIEVLKPDSGIDANEALGLPSGINYTLRLYKNDKLLYKDGRIAIVTSSPQSSWSNSISAGVKLVVKVDKTPAVEYTFENEDFVKADTGYSTVASNNSLEAWAKVFNYKIPGITASVTEGRIAIKSNRGANDDAAIVLSEPNTSNNLIAKGVFLQTQLSAYGKGQDYTINRNTGQIKLTKPLAVGDSLSAGDAYTRAYVQGNAITNGVTDIATGGATAWVVVDGAANVLSTAINGATLFTITSPSNSRYRYTASINFTFGSTQSGAYISVGDWVVIYDPNLNVRGIFRIVAVGASPYTWFEVDSIAPLTQSSTPLARLGMVFVRSSAPVQRVRLSSGTAIPLASIASEINRQLVGATASVYRNTHLRITTNTFGANGDILVVATDNEGSKLLLPEKVLATNTVSHLAAIESGNSEIGTPNFKTGSGGLDNNFDLSLTSGSVNEKDIVSWNRGLDHFGNSVGYRSFTSASNALRNRGPKYTILAGGLTRVGSTVTASIPTGHYVSKGDIVLLSSPDTNFAGGVKVVTNATDTTFTYSEAGTATTSTLDATVMLDQGLGIMGTQPYAESFSTHNPYAIGPTDKLNLVLDNDFINKNYSIPMGRKVALAPGATLSSFGIVDADNSNAHMNVAFGNSNPNFFKDFALYMRARVKSHDTGSGKAILWRYARLGSDGNGARIKYVNPTAPNQSLSASISNVDVPTISVALPSGALRSGTNIENNTRFTITSSTSGVASVIRFTYSTISLVAGKLVRDGSGIVTATTPSNHGYTVGATVYLTSTDANFPGGAKVIQSVPTSTTFTYTEAGTATSNTIAVTISASSVAPTFSGIVVVGDVVNIGAITGLGAALTGAHAVTAVGSNYFEYRVRSGATAPTSPVSVENTSNVMFYPINTAASKVSDIVSWINANVKDIVTAVAVDGGTGTITKATEDEYLSGTANDYGNTSTAQWTMGDGVAYVNNSNLAAEPCTLSLKHQFSVSLATNNDLENEEMYLTPVTVDAISRYINSPAVSGVYTSSEIKASSRNSKLQIVSNTIGSNGSVQVVGGTANNVNAAVVGAASLINSNSQAKVTIPASQSDGFMADNWVMIKNANRMSKNITFATTDTITITNVGVDQWKIKFGTTVVRSDLLSVDASSLGTEELKRVLVRKIGDFTNYFWNNSGVSIGGLEGAWIDFNLNSLSAINTGVKQIVRTETFNNFWIKNPNSIEEEVKLITIRAYGYDSVMPGDTFVIDTTKFGAQNRGSFTVIAFGSNVNEFIVSGKMTAISATTIGNESQFLRVVEEKPLTLFKRITSINRHPSNSNFIEITLDNNNLYNKISASAGSVVYALDKLGFDTGVVRGADAYSHSTGLIGEVTRVLYGDPSNTSVYPGVVAAGANVNVAGPLTKRIQVSLAIRIRSASTAEDIIDAVKNIVASTINRTALGQPIAIGSIIAAAQSVDGVVAAVPLSPVYGPGNDLIPVQAHEKPRVLDVDSDILVSIIGN